MENQDGSEYNTQNSRKKKAENRSKPSKPEELNWSLLGNWISKAVKTRVCFVEAEGWGFFNGKFWHFEKAPSAPLLDFVREQYAYDISETGKTQCQPQIDNLLA